MKIIFIFWISSILCFACKSKSNNNNEVFFLNIDNSLVLLTVSNGDCSTCDWLFEHPYYKNIDLPKLKIDIKESNNNKLLSQALWTTGFPTTYFINADYEIIGITEGHKEFQQYADSICYFGLRFEDTKMSLFGIEKDAVLPVLSYSLKALRSYSINNLLDAKLNAKFSLEKGAYFFNNYLLYKIYKKENNQDSINFYRQAALQHKHSVNAYIYDNLIEELQ